MNGKIASWNDDKGYGFISPNSGESKFLFMSVLSVIVTAGQRLDRSLPTEYLMISRDVLVL